MQRTSIDNLDSFLPSIPASKTTALVEEKDGLESSILARTSIPFAIADPNHATASLNTALAEVNYTMAE